MHRHALSALQASPSLGSVRLIFGITLLLVSLTVPASPLLAQPSAEEQGLTILERRQGQGEQCLVCGQGIHGKEIVEVRYKGRTFHIAAGMLEEFVATPETYFRNLEPRSGLFDEQAMPLATMSKGWLYLGLYVVIGLVFAALCGYLAIGRGLAPLPWFFAGLAGNVAALVLLLLTPRGDPKGVPAGLAKVNLTALPRQCPACSAMNHPAAAACSACDGHLQPMGQPETARV